MDGKSIVGRSKATGPAAKEIHFYRLFYHLVWRLLMDRNIFSNDSVGEFFNSRFLCVKVQMDRTMKDDDNVRQWYDDAKTIAEQWPTLGFPAFIFLFPDATIVLADVGFKNVTEFITLGTAAISQE